MTRTLVLVRHARAGWGEPGAADHDRKLDAHGLREAPLMGERLKQRGVRPDTILSSSAVRARATAQLMAQAMAVDAGTVVADGRLYASSADELLGVIRQLDDRLACVMLVGHNPGIGELAQRFHGDIAGMPTAAVLEVRLEIAAWSDAGVAAAKDAWFDHPQCNRGRPR